MSQYATTYGLIARELKTDAVVSVCGAFGDRLAPPVKVSALWDTGAYASVVSERIVSALGLLPINYQRACGVNGWYESPVYLVDIMLPNKMKITGVSVSRGELVAADMLIGMDIISLGDMLVTNKPTTEFTFRIPSEGNKPFDVSDSKTNNI